MSSQNLVKYKDRAKFNFLLFPSAVCFPLISILHGNSGSPCWFPSFGSHANIYDDS